MSMAVLSNLGRKIIHEVEFAAFKVQFAFHKYFEKNYAKIVGAELVSALISGQTRGLPLHYCVFLPHTAN